MKLLLANPNATERVTHACAELARAIALAGTEIVEWTNRRGPALIDSYDTDAAAARTVVADLPTLRPLPDAVVLAGFGDYGTRAVKESLAVPVVALPEAALTYALTLCSQFTIVTTASRMISYTKDVVERLGFAARCRAVCAVELPPIAAGEPRAEDLVPNIVDVAASADADLIVLGGSRLSPYATALRANSALTVVEPVACAVTLAESLVRIGARV